MMLVHCLVCPSSVEVSADAGAATCSACGGVLVWPSCASPSPREAESRARAQRRLARFALRYGVMPWTLPRLISSREERDHIYARVGWNVEERTPTLTYGLAHGSRARDVTAPPDPTHLDPWACDPERVPADTTRVVVCPSCEGTKKVTCQSCAGVGRLRCDRCFGSGRVMGKKRTRNCPSCRGRGDRDCPSCTNGLHGCPTCAQLGRVHTWVEIVIRRFVTVTVRADFDVDKAHPAVRQGEDFDRERASLPADLLADSGWRSPNDGWQLSPELVPGLDGRTQRVIGVRAQALFAPGTRFHYATRWRESVVELSGYPPRPVEGGELRPLRSRALASLAAGVVTAIGGLYGSSAYLSRSDWFVAHGNGEWLLLLTPIAAVASLFACLEASLPARSRARVGWGLSLAVMLATAIAGCFVWTSVGPSVAVAQQALAAGNVDRADEELRALADLHLAPEEVDALSTELRDERGQRADAERLQEVSAAPTLSAASSLAREAWHDQGHGKLARARLLQLSEEAMEAAWPAKDARALREVASAVHGLDDVLETRARRLSLLADTANCVARGEFACARDGLVTVDSRQLLYPRIEVLALFVEAIVAELETLLALGLDTQADLEARASALDRALELAQLYQEVVGEPYPGLDRAKVERAQQSIIAELERLSEKQRRAEVRAERKRERERAAAARAAERRAWSMQSLRCRDGSYSPSCTCGGSRRGCCSHRGGVAGCG